MKKQLPCKTCLVLPRCKERARIHLLQSKSTHWSYTVKLLEECDILIKYVSEMRKDKFKRDVYPERLDKIQDFFTGTYGSDLFQNIYKQFEGQLKND